ncbi:MAG: nucleoside-diphosphate sugar epimerase/dehydratase [Thermodesulfobacteriota bacterium]
MYNLTPLFKTLFKKTVLKRFLFFLISDAILFSMALYLSFYLRFEGIIPDRYLVHFYISLPLFISIKMLVFYFFQIYRFTWSYIGLYELIKVFMAQTLSLLLISASILFFAYGEPLLGFPRSIFLIDYAFSLIMVEVLRASKRAYIYVRRGSVAGRSRTLIIGAGDAGVQIVREMKTAKDSPYLPVAFIDDDPSKKRVSIQGVEVAGMRMDITRISKKLDIELAVIAMPSASPMEIRDIVSYLYKAGINEIRVIPGTKEIISRDISILDIKKIEVEDLLGREPVEIEYAEVERNLKGKRILVTGAGGSIGSELVRQISLFDPKLLVILDCNETALFHISREIKEHYQHLSVYPVLGDILDKEKMGVVFRNFAPQIVFHAAAYKHVPIVEDFPEEAVRVNILGTEILAKLSYQYGVEKFVFISTDKVVNPTSVMGASKRVAEMMITYIDQQQTTHFMAVRFGNVLGSRGSVIPLFQEQIRQGGPLTITHPEMKRYFMTIAEAVILVLQAGTMGKGGEVFVLDMGEPVKIYDIACELIRLSGLEPEKDIPIVFSGIRPGEKLFEELLTAEEGVEPTEHPKIFKARIKEPFSQEFLFRKIEELENFARLQDTPSIITTLKEIIPTYTPNRLSKLS